MTGIGRTGRVLASAVEAIGDTPLVELSRVTAGRSGRILAKLENLNPGLSKKDRIARQILEEAVASGALGTGQPVIELTSGNTGTGAAIVCAVQQRPFIAVMSKGNSPERARMMSALGAEVVLIDQAPGSPVGQVSGMDLALVEIATERLAQARGAFRIDQFVRDGNWRAHQVHTATEIWDASGGAIEVFCDFVGSGGTFAGLWHGFKARDPAIRGYVIEPEGAAILKSGDVLAPNHRIQGGGYALANPTQLAGIVPDGYLTVSDAEAVSATRLLAAREGIFAGFSSGANLAGALKLLDHDEQGKTICIVVCDSGLKYLSTDLWLGTSY